MPAARSAGTPEKPRPERWVLPRREEWESIQPQFILPPRYATHEEAVARVYGLTDVRDAGLVKGAKATWNWLADLFKGPPAVSAAGGGAALQ